MPLVLQATVIILSVLFLIGICNLVAHGRMQIKYSLVWILLAIIILVLAIFPQIVYWLSGLLGFVMPSNFVFSFGLAFLLITSVSLSVIVSWQAHHIRLLIQEVSLLKKQVNKTEDDIER